MLYTIYQYSKSDLSDTTVFIIYYIVVIREMYILCHNLNSKLEIHPTLLNQ